MKRLDSTSLLIMGTGFLILALFMSSLPLQAIVLAISVVLNIIAIVRSFKEKKKNNS